MAACPGWEGEMAYVFRPYLNANFHPENRTETQAHIPFNYGHKLDEQELEQLRIEADIDYDRNRAVGNFKKTLNELIVCEEFRDIVMNMEGGERVQFIRLHLRNYDKKKFYYVNPLIHLDAKDIVDFENSPGVSIQPGVISEECYVVSYVNQSKILFDTEAVKNFPVWMIKSPWANYYYVSDEVVEKLHKKGICDFDANKLESQRGKEI